MTEFVDSQFLIPDSRPVIHVVAGVIQDPRGRILLARRTEGRDLAGLWEFPGGKVDPGETPEQALARELHEELGIHVQSSAPFIKVPQIYRDKRIVLDVRRIGIWSGNATGREQQALAWVPAAKLPSYPMPSADRPVVAALLHPDLYLITPEPEPEHLRPSGQQAFLRGLEVALQNGVRLVQLRCRTLDQPSLRTLAELALASCREAEAELLVNADIALALALGIGVHLRSAQLMRLRERPPAMVRVSASCHNTVELEHAQSLGLDFVVLGPVAVTPSHPERVPLGWEGFSYCRQYVSLPIYALGGLQQTDLPSARAHGAQGVAAIRSLWPGSTSSKLVGAHSSHS